MIHKLHRVETKHEMFIRVNELILHLEFLVGFNIESCKLSELMKLINITMVYDHMIHTYAKLSALIK